MPNPDNVLLGRMHGMSREEIAAYEMSDSLRSVAASIEHHVDLADQSARDSAVAAAKSERRARSAEIRGWISVGISGLALMVSIIALLR